MMMKVLQINVCIAAKSTGRIAEQIGQLAMENGFDSYIAYGDETHPSKSVSIKIGTNFERLLHRVANRIFDLQGRASHLATKRFLKKVDEIKPDIVHLHNLHCCYLNYHLLFDYLIKNNIPIVWTLHDCWSMTGSCAHFDFIGCDKWKTGCRNCKQRLKFRLDNSSSNYALKKKTFTRPENMTIVPVSNWLGDIVKESYLSKYNVQVIYNGVDLNVFKPMPQNDLKNKLNIAADKFVLLGVGTAWSNDKGLREFIELSRNSQYQVVLVGVSDELKHQLPTEIVSIAKTNSQQELASYYSMADVFVNPTYNDSFPTVNLEALACGTPVITYKTGGSPEAVDESTGLVVPRGDIGSLKNAVELIRSDNEAHASVRRKQCRERAEVLFNKDARYNDYITLYKSILHIE